MKVHALLIQKEKKAIAFERDACDAKEGSHQALVNPYHAARTYVAKRHSNTGVCLETALVVAVNEAEDERSHCQRVCVYSLKYFCKSSYCSYPDFCVLMFLEDDGSSVYSEERAA